MRIILNAIIMLGELAAIAGVAWLGYTEPLLFAGLTLLIALGLGISLEIARLRNELPFYFDRTPGTSSIIPAAVGALEALVKAILAGVVGLLTFLGTDPDRLMWVAVIFAVCLFIGCGIVRYLNNRFAARPLRWGYFRLAAPLGLLFSAGQSLLPSVGLTELARRVTFDLPEQPSLAQASEFLFLIKQSFDDMVQRMLAWVFEPPLADAIATLFSVNVLTGFIIALYAVLIAEGVRQLESRL